MLSFQFPEYHVTGLTLADECRSWGLEADTILQSTGLSGRSSMPPLSLSRGELKRLHLACVMAKNYDLLVLDEPFSSLDSREKYQFCKNLEEQKTGICIIFTHEHTILPRVNHIWEIVDGVLYNRGSPPEAILHWYTAPPIIKQLIMEGKVPKNVSLTDLKEVSCRTHG
jgi:energy-coupling factor transport system ATP-binding protein